MASFLVLLSEDFGTANPGKTFTQGFLDNFNQVAQGHPLAHTLKVTGEMTEIEMLSIEADPALQPIIEQAEGVDSIEQNREHQMLTR